MSQVILMVQAPVLAAGIHSLLASAGDLDVIVLSDAPDVEVSAAVSALKPSVIVVDSDFACQRMLAMLSCLGADYRWRVLQIDDETNVVAICDRQSVILKQASEFVAYVREVGASSGNARACPKRLGVPAPQ